MTRSYISFAFGKSSQYSLNLTSSYDATLKKIVQYLKEPKELGFRYGLQHENTNGKLLGYIDASYRDCLDTSCLIFKYIYLL